MSSFVVTLDFSVGNDARKAIADGYPVDRVITSDLEPGKQNTGVHGTILIIS